MKELIVGRGAHEADAEVTLTADLTPQGSVYLLVHPERFPSNDWSVVLPNGVREDEVHPAFFAHFERLYGAELTSRSALCTRRIVVLDSLSREALEFEDDRPHLDPPHALPELTEGLASAGWEILEAEPDGVAAAVRKRFAGSTASVVVGGYARTDCVKRAVGALRRLKLVVELHDSGTLPLSTPALLSYHRALPDA